MSFSDDVYSTVQKIPLGSVATYGQIALLTGHPNGARVVGGILSRNPYGDAVPWHRVLRANGQLAAGGHKVLQEKLLRSEGVEVHDGVVPLIKFQWNSNIV